MSIGEALSIIKNALTTIMLVGGPVLIVSLVVGILISLFQALTQIHEATLAFAPKILIVFIVLIILGGWMLNTLVDYSRNIFTQMGGVLPR
ncbi:MAG: flagellar biosynthesis protein FliQ [bacterium]